MKRYIFVGVLIITVLVGAVSAVRYFNPFQLSSADTQKVRGNPSSPIEIIEFSDFECGGCKAVQPLLKEILDEFQGKVKLRFMHFPLRRHKHSLLAHVASECAAREGKFWAFHDKLYEEQEVWSKSEDAITYLTSYAESLGMDLERFKP